MTAAELNIVVKLVEAHRMFIALPVQHPNDREEWCEKLHELQRMVMSRDAVRNHPKYFLNIEKQSEVETVSPAY
jgi:hypothetical protein